MTLFFDTNPLVKRLYVASKPNSFKQLKESLNEVYKDATPGYLINVIQINNIETSLYYDSLIVCMGTEEVGVMVAYAIMNPASAAPLPNRVIRTSEGDVSFPLYPSEAFDTTYIQMVTKVISEQYPDNTIEVVGCTTVSEKVLEDKAHQHNLAAKIGNALADALMDEHPEKPEHPKWSLPNGSAIVQKITRYASSKNTNGQPVRTDIGITYHIKQTNGFGHNNDRTPNTNKDAFLELATVCGYLLAVYPTGSDKKPYLKFVVTAMDTPLSLSISMQLLVIGLLGEVSFKPLYEGMESKQDIDERFDEAVQIAIDVPRTQVEAYPLEVFAQAGHNNKYANDAILSAFKQACDPHEADEHTLVVESVSRILMGTMRLRVNGGAGCVSDIRETEYLNESCHFDDNLPWPEGVDKRINQLIDKEFDPIISDIADRVNLHVGFTKYLAKTVYKAIGYQVVDESGPRRR